MHVHMQHDSHKQWRSLEAVMSEEDTVLRLILVGLYFSRMVTIVVCATLICLFLENEGHVSFLLCPM